MFFTDNNTSTITEYIVKPIIINLIDEIFFNNFDEKIIQELCNDMIQDTNFDSNDNANLKNAITKIDNNNCNSIKDLSAFTNTKILQTINILKDKSIDEESSRLETKICISAMTESIPLIDSQKISSSNLSNSSSIDNIYDAYYTMRCDDLALNKDNNFIDLCTSFISEEDLSDYENTTKNIRLLTSEDINLSQNETFVKDIILNLLEKVCDETENLSSANCNPINSKISANKLFEEDIKNTNSIKSNFIHSKNTKNKHCTNSKSIIEFKNVESTVEINNSFDNTSFGVKIMGPKVKITRPGLKYKSIFYYAAQNNTVLDNLIEYDEKIWQNCTININDCLLNTSLVTHYKLFTNEFPTSVTPKNKNINLKNTARKSCNSLKSLFYKSKNSFKNVKQADIIPQSINTIHLSKIMPHLNNELKSPSLVSNILNVTKKFRRKEKTKEKIQHKKLFLDQINYDETKLDQSNNILNKTSHNSLSSNKTLSKPENLQLESDIITNISSALEQKYEPIIHLSKENGKISKIDMTESIPENIIKRFLPNEEIFSGKICKSQSSFNINDCSYKTDDFQPRVKLIRLNPDAIENLLHFIVNGTLRSLESNNRVTDDLLENALNAPIVPNIKDYKRKDEIGLTNTSNISKRPREEEGFNSNKKIKADKSNIVHLNNVKHSNKQVNTPSSIKTSSLLPTDIDYSLTANRKMQNKNDIEKLNSPSNNNERKRIEQATHKTIENNLKTEVNNTKSSSNLVLQNGEKLSHDKSKNLITQKSSTRVSLINKDINKKSDLTPKISNNSIKPIIKKPISSTIFNTNNKINGLNTADAISTKTANIKINESTNSELKNVSNFCTTNILEEIEQSIRNEGFYKWGNLSTKSDADKEMEIALEKIKLNKKISSMKTDKDNRPAPSKDLASLGRVSVSSNRSVVRPESADLNKSKTVSHIPDHTKINTLDLPWVRADMSKDPLGLESQILDDVLDENQIISSDPPLKLTSALSVIPPISSQLQNTAYNCFSSFTQKNSVKIPNDKLSHNGIAATNMASNTFLPKLPDEDKLWFKQFQSKSKLNSHPGLAQFSMLLQQSLQKLNFETCKKLILSRQNSYRPVQDFLLWTLEEQINCLTNNENMSALFNSISLKEAISFLITFLKEYDSQKRRIILNDNLEINKSNKMSLMAPNLELQNCSSNSSLDKNMKLSQSVPITMPDKYSTINKILDDKTTSKNTNKHLYEEISKNVAISSLVLNKIIDKKPILETPIVLNTHKTNSVNIMYEEKRQISHNMNTKEKIVFKKPLDGDALGSISDELKRINKQIDMLALIIDVHKDLCEIGDKQRPDVKTLNTVKECPKTLELWTSGPKTPEPEPWSPSPSTLEPPANHMKLTQPSLSNFCDEKSLDKEEAIEAARKFLMHYHKKGTVNLKEFKYIMEKTIAKIRKTNARINEKKISKFISKYVDKITNNDNPI